MEPWAAAKKKKKLLVSVVVPPAPVRVPSQRPLIPSVASVTSVANDKGDNEMILRTGHRSPYNRGKPFLQMRSVGSHSMSGREKE